MCIFPRFWRSPLRERDAVGRSVAPSEPSSDWPAVLNRTRTTSWRKWRNVLRLKCCRPIGASSRVAGLMRRGDGTGRKLQSVALTSLTEFPRRQSARVPARPAGKPRRRPVFGGCRPGSVGLSGRVADARDRAAGTPGDRGEMFAGQSDAIRPEMAVQAIEKPRFAPGNGALQARRSAGPGLPSSIGGGLRFAGFARKWRRKGLKRLNPRPEIAPPTRAVHRKPVACCLPSAVDETECESPGTPKAARAGAVRNPRTSSRGAHRLRQWAGCSLAAGRRRDSILGVAFLIWTARNPLKSPESDEGIQDNPSPFSWSGLVWIWFGLEGPEAFRRRRRQMASAGCGRRAPLHPNGKSLSDGTKDVAESRDAREWRRNPWKASIRARKRRRTGPPMNPPNVRATSPSPA